MIPIICAILLLVIYLLLDEKKYKKIGILLSVILIFCIFAFRNSTVGIDDSNYKLYYDLILSGMDKKFFNVSGVEYSFYFICKILSLLKLNYKSLFIVYSSMSFTFFYKILKKIELTKNEYFLFLLSFLAFATIPYITIMRQFAASMIAIYAIIDNKNNVKSILIIFLAMLFHLSAIIFLPILIIRNMEKNKIFKCKWTYVLVPIISMIINYSGLAYYIAKKILSLTPYARYVESAKITSFGGSSIVVITMFIIYIFGILLSSDEEFSKTKNRSLIILSCCFFTLYFLTLNLGVLGRIYDYFIIFEFFGLILLSRYIFKIPKIKTIYVVCCTLLLSFFIVYNTFIVDNNRFDFNNYSLNIWRK